jgi:hypothetical protein
MRDVLQILGVAVSFRQAEVNAVHGSPGISKADDEVGRLDVSMY